MKCTRLAQSSHLPHPSCARQCGQGAFSIHCGRPRRTQLQGINSFSAQIATAFWTSRSMFCQEVSFRDITYASCMANDQNCKTLASFTLESRSSGARRAGVCYLHPDCALCCSNLHNFTYQMSKVVWTCLSPISPGQISFISCGLSLFPCQCRFPVSLLMLQVEVGAAIWVCLKTEDNTNLIWWLMIDQFPIGSHICISYIVIIFHQNYFHGDMSKLGTRW